jgi:hypothetical protein
MVRDLNAGNLFKEATGKQAFRQMTMGDAKTSNVTSVTGSTLGTSKILTNAA